MDDTLKRLEDLIKKELGKIIAKGDMTPSELETSCKAVEALGKIREYESGAMNNQMSMMYSDARGRDPMTGQFVSRNSMPYPGAYDNAYGQNMNSMTSPMVAGNSYNNGYSGHSIKDRMFQRLEQMLPEAQNENERQLIHQYMRKLDSE